MLAVRPVITTPIMPMTTTAVLAMVLALVGFFGREKCVRLNVLEWGRVGWRKGSEDTVFGRLRVLCLGGWMDV